MPTNLSNFLSLQLSPQTKRIYGFAIKRFLKHFEDSPPKGNAWTKDYIVCLKNQGLSNRSVNHQMTIIKQFYKFCFSTVLFYDRLKENSKPVEFLTPQAVSKLLQASPEPFRAVLMFMLDTGCRVSEISSLSAQIFDRVSSEFVVTGKGQRQRTLIISQDTKKLLEKNGLIFGRVWSVRAIQYNLNKIAPDIHPHMLRHTFATQMLRQGVDIQDIQHILGHKYLSTTQIYTHVTPDRLREVWNNYLTNVKNQPDDQPDTERPV